MRTILMCAYRAAISTLQTVVIAGVIFCVSFMIGGCINAFVKADPPLPPVPQNVVGIAAQYGTGFNPSALSAEQVKEMVDAEKEWKKNVLKTLNASLSMQIETYKLLAGAKPSAAAIEEVKLDRVAVHKKWCAGCHLPSKQDGKFLLWNDDDMTALTFLKPELKQKKKDSIQEHRMPKREPGQPAAKISEAERKVLEE